jgi:hypothetical protein
VLTQQPVGGDPSLFQAGVDHPLPPPLIHLEIKGCREIMHIRMEWKILALRSRHSWIVFTTFNDPIRGGLNICINVQHCAGTSQPVHGLAVSWEKKSLAVQRSVEWLLHTISPFLVHLAWCHRNCSSFTVARPFQKRSFMTALQIRCQHSMFLVTMPCASESWPSSSASRALDV